MLLLFLILILGYCTGKRRNPTIFILIMPFSPPGFSLIMPFSFSTNKRNWCLYVCPIVDFDRFGHAIGDRFEHIDERHTMIENNMLGYQSRQPRWMSDYALCVQRCEPTNSKVAECVRQRNFWVSPFSKTNKLKSDTGSSK